MIHDKIPTTVITGFLGAGKTTLIRHLLATANGRRLALIINEFGDVGVDAEIVKGCAIPGCREEDVIELVNGCICCTVADDFIPAMSKLLARASPPEHIIIETSGLALPQPLVRAFQWPEIRPRVTVDGVVTVVDGAAVADGRFATDEAALAAQRAADPSLEHDNPIAELFEDQLACSDIVLMNKTDLVAGGRLERTKEELAQKLRAGTPLIATTNGRISAAVLLGLGAGAEDDLARRPSHHELSGELEHDHDDFETFVVRVRPVSDKRAYLARIPEVIARHDLLRLKGFLAVDDVASRLLIQAVGPRLDHYFDRPWRAGEDRVGHLVVIGLKGLDRNAIAAELQQ